jgi:hypothetical protein
MLLLPDPKKRRSTRRAVAVPCIAVSTNTYQLLGQQVLDLSPRGMLLSSSSGVKLGDHVFVSFLPPGEGRWMNAHAEVTRLIPGLRTWDAGPSVGLVFTNLSVVKRGELLARLAGIPPTVPRRPLRYKGDVYLGANAPILPSAPARPLPDGLWRDLSAHLGLSLSPVTSVARGVFSN